MKHRAILSLLLAAALPTIAAASPKRGQYSFATERACVSGSDLGAELCANAAANAQAEFDEKSPRFPTREACERVFRAAGCSLGFKGADGWAGKKSGVYFSPRQRGFHVVVSSDRNMIAIPWIAGPAIAFASRSILKRDVRIDSSVARNARASWRPTSGHAPAASGAFGVESPGAPAGPLPPPPPVDPNFDCAAVLEPSARDTASTACYPVPARRR